MKRYIDEKTGKVVNILEKDEANKIVKILIDYFFLETTVPSGRLNLVGFLRDFIKLGDIEDLNKIVEYIGEYKKTLKLAKEEEENFEVLYKFFRMYKDLEDAKLGIEDATNYISEMTNKKEELASKDQKDMTKKDKILKVFFDNGFEFKRLAKVACEAWGNHLKEQMNSGKKEIFVSLEQEIAYQDLLEFANSDNADISKKQTEKKSEATIKEAEQTEEKKEVKAKNEELKQEPIDKASKVDINVQVPDRKEPVKIEIETKKEEKVPEKVEEKAEQKVESVDKKEEKIHTIHIDPLAGEHEELVSNVNNNPHPPHKVEHATGAHHHQITQHEINSLLGLDDDLENNSNAPNAQPRVEEKVESKVESVDKKQENIPTIQINPLVEDKKDSVNAEEKNRREQGYTSNIHIYVPGVDDEQEPDNINPTEIKKATEDVDLKDSVEFFNDVLDDRMSKKSSLTDEPDDFRD